ncbi:MAG TPA: MarR family winged helix-turn-helix transcriptional regulator [Thermoleophilaceae bacterium]
MTDITQTWTPLPALLDDLADFGFAEFHQHLNQAGHPSIRPGHGCVFRFIHEDGSRLTELAESSGLTKQAVGEVVADLEGLGYVERAPDPEDGRAKLIKLTKLGNEARATAVEIFEGIEREWAERFGAERVAAMRELLEEVVGESGTRPLPFRPPSTPRTPPA